MHRCLYIQEILHVIFSRLDVHQRVPVHAEPPRTESSLRTLAALARTCKIFTEQALDILWSEIPNPYFLVKYLLPEDTVRYTSTSLVCLSVSPQKH